MDDRGYPFTGGQSRNRDRHWRPWIRDSARTGGGRRHRRTGRSEQQGLESVANVRTQFPRAQIRFAMLDLASLASVADFSHRFASDQSTLDLLVNNAGVMSPPKRQTTADGFELQFGT